MPASPRLHILIVGGGLAGLAAASFLREHHDVTVLERFKLEFSRNDYAMSVAPNTHRLLLQQGIEAENLQETVLTYVWVCDASGKVVRESLSESLARFGTTTIFTRRSRLHAELYTLATTDRLPGKPACVIEEVKISNIDVTEGTITTDSGDTFRGDIIIGADGINSAARPAVLCGDVAGGAAAVPSGLAAYLCTVPHAVLAADPVLAFLTGERAGMASFRGADPRRRILVYPADAGAFQIVAYHSEDRWAAQFAREGSSIIRHVAAARVVEDFADFHPSIQDMLRRATTPDVWRIRDLDPLSRWCAGKAVLIGDAAHAVTPHFGQGCNIAIEDAEALGYFLRTVTSAAQLPDALASFEALRIPRAHMVQFASRQVAGQLSEEEQKKAGQFDSAAFMTKVYGYKSAEDAWEEFRTSETEQQCAS